MSEIDTEFSKDLLRGADAIAEFLYGDRRMRRRVYHLTETSRLPHFKLGSMTCARKSVLLKWFESQEEATGAKEPKASGNVTIEKV